VLHRPLRILRRVPVFNFEQTAWEHPAMMKSGKQTSRTGRTGATALNGTVGAPPLQVWEMAMFA
jgi:hypothetical protein